MPEKYPHPLTNEVKDTSNKTFLRSISLIKKDTSTAIAAEVDSTEKDIVNEDKFFTEGTLLAMRFAKTTHQTTRNLSSWKF